MCIYSIVLRQSTSSHVILAKYIEPSDKINISHTSKEIIRTAAPSIVRRPHMLTHVCSNSTRSTHMRVQILSTDRSICKAIKSRVASRTSARWSCTRLNTRAHVAARCIVWFYVERMIRRVSETYTSTCGTCDTCTSVCVGNLKHFNYFIPYFRVGFVKQVEMRSRLWRRWAREGLHFGFYNDLDSLVFCCSLYILVCLCPYNANVKRG